MASHPKAARHQQPARLSIHHLNHHSPFPLHHHHLIHHHSLPAQILHPISHSCPMPSTPPHSRFACSSPSSDDDTHTPTLASRPSLPPPAHPPPPPPSSTSSSYPPLEPDTSSSSSSASSASSLASPAFLPRKPTTLFLLPGPALAPLLIPHQPRSLHPPTNFATIAPGLFRASFPRPENFEFLARLGLRTVLTLVQEQYPIELVQHYERQGIKLIQFGIPGNKEPFVHIPEDKIRLALRQVLDVRNHPMLIHCNKGKHRTGCLVGCLRKLQHWSSTAIFDEYRRYAFPKSRNMDQQFIELFDHSAVWEEIDPDYAPEWLDLTI